ncbi:hypothetical protein [Streptomyces sp. NPDC005953]|uniref:hypothetical protein n=1 Tax=Streptomyces sp. NPDC005953 TaxID=3156719 RepID=UPI0033DE66F0
MSPSSQTPPRDLTGRLVQHAVTAYTRTTPGRQAVVLRHAEGYLAQVDRRTLPVGYDMPILDDSANAADAWRMRRGTLLARLLGLSVRSTDCAFPAAVRAVVAHADAPVHRLMVRASRTGQPAAVALVHLVGGAA